MKLTVEAALVSPGLGLQHVVDGVEGAGRKLLVVHFVTRGRPTPVSILNILL